MTATGESLFGELQKNWGWLLALGILSIVLGVIGLGMTFALTVASVFVYGVLILVGVLWRRRPRFRLAGVQRGLGRGRLTGLTGHE